MSWDDAIAFCKKLTARERAAGELPDGCSYSLPTESQWEMLVADASLKDAVMELNGPCSSTAPVGSLGPNSLGLYDTRGNVMEWCLDAHDPSYHVLRGGGWDTIAEPSSRIEFRWYAHLTDGVRNDFGFRVVFGNQRRAVRSTKLKRTWVNTTGDSLMNTGLQSGIYL